MVWVVDVIEPSWVGGMSVVTIGTVLLVEEPMRAVLGMALCNSPCLLEGCQHCWTNQAQGPGY